MSWGNRRTPRAVNRTTLLRRLPLVTVVCVSFWAHAGCSLELVDLMPLLESEQLLELDPDTGPVTVGEEGRVSCRRPSILSQSHPCRAGYDGLLWHFTRIPFVKGRLPNGREYPVMLDSGYSVFPLLVTLDVALENDIPLSLGELRVGYVERLTIGGTTIENLPCLWYSRQWQYRFLGFPLYRLRGFVIGLPLLAKFEYVLFDNVEKSAELSAEVPFSPEDPTKWWTCELLFENGMLMVDMPVAGKETRLLLDTAGGPHLILHPNDWNELSERVTTRYSRRKDFPSWGGKHPVKEHRVGELSIGPRALRDARVWVSEVPRVSSLGMGCFEHTTIVLDFGRNRLWVKNPRR